MSEQSRPSLWKKAPLAVLAVLGLATGVTITSGPAHADTGVTGTLAQGPVPTYVSTKTIYSGPSKAYPPAGTAQAGKSYAVLCTTASGARKPGTAGPVAYSDATGAWDRIADPASPDQPIGYLLDADLALTSGGTKTDWTSLTACPAPPPLPEGDPQHPVVRAPSPGWDIPRNKCAAGILDPGLNTISFTSEQTIDIEFSTAALGITGIDVTDKDTGYEDSGNASPVLLSTKNGPTSWRFKERANGTGVTTHTFSVTVGGAVGGKNTSVEGGGVVSSGAGASLEQGGKADGDTSEGDVSWEARSIACPPKA
ncbi:hypothetical protein [Actinoallomurus sp. NPDC050550]|uniref:hypothetical protein n=1 Tax=Actinoallomurus sp. NPDC050550 TaxID=3154937 RepID=UPI0033CFB952